MSQSTIIPRGHHFHFHFHLHKVLPWFFIFTLVTCSLEHYLALVLQLSYFTQSFEVKNSSVQLLSLVGKSQSALGWSSFQISNSLRDAHHMLLLKLGLLTFSHANVGHDIVSWLLNTIALDILVCTAFVVIQLVWITKTELATIHVFVS